MGRAGTNIFNLPSAIWLTICGREGGGGVKPLVLLYVTAVGKDVIYMLLCVRETQEVAEGTLGLHKV